MTNQIQDGGNVGRQPLGSCYAR